MNVAIVTGASRGIGKAVADRLAKDGFAVVVNYVSNAPEAEQGVAEIKSQGGEAIAIKADVSDASQVEQLFAQTLERWGTIDVVIQNSGIMPLSPIGKGDAETFDKVIRVNLRGTFLVLAPGATAFTVSFRPRSSFASTWTSPSTPGRCKSRCRVCVRADGDTGWGIPQGFARTAVPDADIAEVANAIAKIVDMPFGKRAFRVHIDPANDGAEVVNGVADRVRTELLRNMGLADLLHPTSGNPE